MAREKQKLTLIELRKVLATLPKDAFIVCFYANMFYAPQSDWMNALAEKLRQRGMITVGLLTPRSVKAFNLDKTDYVAVVPSSTVKILSRINVFIISEPDHSTHFPAGSKVLGCIHSHMMSFSDRPYPYQLFSVGMLDGLMVPARLPAETRHALEKTWTGFVNPRWSRRSKGPFYVIPVGYPRHAAMFQALSKAMAPKDAIVYAPHGIANTSDIKSEHCVVGAGIPIINFLLENFPEYKVIFRPAPEDLEGRVVQRISSLYRQERRFILDTHPDQFFSLSRGAALVTDASGIARSFAYMTLRPAIFFQPWREWQEPVRRVESGFIATSYDALRDVLKLALENRQEEAEIIRKNRDELLMPIEGALETIADWLPDFYNERPRADWVTIERSEAALEPEKALIQKLATFPDGLQLAAPAVACFRNQESPLLAAYALHMGRIKAPRLLPALDLLGIAGRLLGVKITSDSYEKTPPEHIQNLYTMALKRFEREGDQEGVALVAGLLEHFNAAISKK
ncbi:MAG: hypothetical protein HDQ89_07580 [Desulfovibrio sp.]|nr:hypothetical protein [Desulfovibrio sp.]